MTIEPIAYFHSPLPEKFGIPRQSGLVDNLWGEIRFCDGYRNICAIDGMEGFSHLWLIWGFSLNREDCAEGHLTARPPRLGGNKSVGVFATRSPYRPNPLGLSCVKIDSIIKEGPGAPFIRVKGADLADKTPIYDIKPYIPYADSHPDATSGFVGDNDWKNLDVVIPANLASMLDASEAKALEELLSLDPRPQYHNDPERIYGLSFAGRNIRFKVENGTLTVTQII